MRFRTIGPLRMFPAVGLLGILPVAPLAAAEDASPATRYPAAPRIVAIGDVHGDLDATRRALRLAGAIDDQDRWVGKDLVVVQTGDQLDRGDDEQAILDLFSTLIVEADEAGGAFHVLNGNHELMNAKLDLRYVTPGGFADFEDAVEFDPDDPELAEFEEHQRARVVAFRPGGPYARVLAERNVFVIVGENAFVHGGVLPEHLDYGLERANADVRAWLLGEKPRPEILGKPSPVWTRLYSDEVDGTDCEVLSEVLERLAVTRMVVGHTPQEVGATPLCEGDVWCIDVGMARRYGGPVQVLEIMGDRVRVLCEGPDGSVSTDCAVEVASD